jgi:putative ABC transport system permease protein
MYKDLVKYAFNNINKRLLRSGLTMLSILVGIMALFALISFGQGITRFTNDTFESMGTDKLIMQIKTFGPTGSGSESFSEQDRKVIQRVRGVDIASGISFIFGSIREDPDGESLEAIQMMSVPAEGDEAQLVMDLLTVDVVEGRYVRQGERNAAVLGNNYLEDGGAFDKALHIGDKIYIQGEEIKVVGFLDDIGNPADDKSVLMEKEYFQDLFNIEDKYTFIYIQSKPGVVVADLSERIMDEFRKYKDLEEGQEYFFVQTFEEIMETSGNILSVINSIVVLIALISVLVAAINITNTMYTSVLERTQEIGVMKAIGATNNTIIKIFLIESASLGLIGGLIGMGLGYLIAKAGGAIAVASGYSMLQPYFPIWLIVGSLVFAVGVGTVSGIMPAINASRQKPVDALRYE